MFSALLACVMLVEGGSSAPTQAVGADVSVPVLEIVGPTGGTEGDIVILEAKAETATDINWLLVSGPPDKQGNKPVILPLENDAKCLVQSKAGTYVVVAIASNAGGNVGKIWTITITGNNGPNPPTPPPVPPEVDLTSKYGYTKLTYDAAKASKLPKDVAVTFANVYKKLVDKYKDSQADIDAVAEEERSLNRGNVAEAYRNAMSSWATTKVERDKELIKSSQIQSGADYCKLLSEIERGFRFVAEGK